MSTCRVTYNSNYPGKLLILVIAQKLYFCHCVFSKSLRVGVLNVMFVKLKGFFSRSSNDTIIILLNFPILILIFDWVYAGNITGLLIFLQIITSRYSSPAYISGIIVINFLDLANNYVMSLRIEDTFGRKTTDNVTSRHIWCCHLITNNKL